MPPKQNKTKETASVAPLFPSSVICTLPVWDDAQIAQENWGASLSAATVSSATTAAPSGKDSNKGTTKSGAKDGMSSSCFVDQEGRTLLATVLDGEVKASDRDVRPEANSMGSQSALLSVEAAKSRLSWQRPADVVKPFRPVVHRNTTPFLFPYAPDAQRHPSRRKDASAEVKPPAVASKSSGRKSEAHKETEAEVPHYEQYPETITLLEDLVGQGQVSWDGMPRQEAVERYRDMAPLMQPYNPTLTASCAQTPAEAVGSRYSTALRHKLKAAEALSALAEIPPFFMSGFNSVLLLIHQAQYLAREGHYLWELVYPHAPGTCHPVYNPYGKYAVKLFVDGAYRKVMVDDALPVDELDRPLLTVTSRKELWPAILAKAVVKVCGQNAKDVLLRSPEVMVSMLLGNWVPRYVTADSKDSVDTAAVCLQFARQLATPPPTPLAEAAAGTGGDRTGRGSTQKDAAGKKGKVPLSRPASNSSSRGGSPGGKGPKQNTSRPSSSSAREQGGSVSGTSADSGASPAPLVTVDTGVPEASPPSVPFLVCGLRQTPVNAQLTHPGIGNGVQIYAIASIVPFRNTLALAVRTTPRTDLTDGVFAREHDKPDVHEITHRFEASHAAAPGSKSIDNHDDGAVLRWLTLEEFCASMDTLLVWQYLCGQYTNQLFVESGAGGSEAHSTAAATASAPVAVPAAAPPGKKSHATNTVAAGGGGGAAAAAAAGAAANNNGAPPLEVVRWVKFTCNVPCDVVIVSSRSVNPNAVRDGETANTAAAAAEPNTSQQRVTLPTAVTPSSPTPSASHELELSYYVWDRCDPLTTAMRAAYYTGRVSSTVVNLTAGVHLYRFRLPTASPTDRVVLLSNAEMELLTESPEQGKSSAFCILTDADRRAAVQKADVEYLWFKRKFRIAEPTRLTLLLESLPTSEDLSKHRLLPNAPGKSTGKAAGGGGGKSGGVAASTTNRRSSVASAAAAGHIVATGPEQLDGVSIFRYTKLMLVNLDNRQELVIGESGRLPQLLLQPNAKGYYLTAFTRVCGEDIALLRSTTGIQVDPDSAAPLYGPGLWKLVARSDHELQHVESLPLASNTVTNNGTLGRGGSPLLFRYTCAVTESTHVTIAADIQTRVPGCQFELRITRAGRPVTPGLNSGSASGTTSNAAAAAAAAAAASGAHTAGGSGGVRGERGSNPTSSGRPGTADSAQGRDSEECVLESGWQPAHFFLPEFLLEPIDKSRTATYFIEGRVPTEFAEAWDEQCRYAQEQRFLTLRDDSLRKASARQAEEKQLALDDPGAFVLRKQDEQASQQQQQQLLEQAEKASKDTRSRKKRASIPGATTPASANGAAAPSHRLNNTSLSGEGESITQQLDVVDGSLEVNYHIYIDLSSSKAECKPALPVSSGLTSLRQQWGATLQFMKAIAAPSDAQNSSATATPPPSRGSAGPSRGGGGGGSNSSNRPHQKDSVSSAQDEAAQRAIAAAQRARQQFLANPANLLFPRLEEPTEKEAINSKKDKTSASAARQNTGSDALFNGTIVVDDSEENNYRHAPALAPSQYALRLLPLWAGEISEPTTAADVPVAEKAPLTGSGKRAKPGKEARLSAAAMSTAAAMAASTSQAYAGLQSSSPLQARCKEEQEAAYAAARAGLVQHTASAVDAYKENREIQQKQRRMIKEMVYTFWSDRVQASALATRPSSSDTAPALESTSPMPDTAFTAPAAVVHYTSLLGRAKEENDTSTPARRQKSVSQA